MFLSESGCFFLWNGCPLWQNRDHQRIRRNLPARRIQLDPRLVAQGWEDQATARHLQTLPVLSLVHIAHNFWRQCWVDRWRWGLYASLPRMLPFQDIGAGTKIGDAWGVWSHVWWRARSKHTEERAKAGQKLRSRQSLDSSHVRGGPEAGGCCQWQTWKQPNVLQGALHWRQRVTRGSQAAVITHECYSNRRQSTHPSISQERRKGMKVNWW